MRAWLASLVSLVTLAATARAEPARHRLVLVRVDEPLPHAITVAVEPWSVDVVLSAEGAPKDDDHAAAGALARATRAEILVWIGEGANGRALFVYDVAARRMTSTPLPRPLDDANAASVALTLKTLLRTSAVGPDAPPPVVPPPAPPPSPPPTIPPPTPAIAPRRVWLDAGMSARLGASSAAVAEPRFAFSAAYFPSWFGAGVDLSFGPGTPVSTGGLSGRLNDLDATLGARARFERGRLVAVPFLGVGVHAFILSATVGAGRADATRVNPAAHAGALLGVRVATGVVLALHASVGVLGRWQEVRVDGARAFSDAPAFVDLGLRLCALP